MATKMGAPGVLIAVEDNSAYSTVENPAAIAGVVGYSAKGELNKILNINNSGAMDAILGFGYNNAKHNQGLYATRAVIDNGGVVEFVRPYGEEIDKSSPYKRELKSDAFVVTYDRNAVKYTDQPKNSFQMKHFAATRYKTDAAAEFGVTRKVNNIAETVTTGKNVEFMVSAGDEFSDSRACRHYDLRKDPTDIVLFSIINSDPSSANRACESFEIIDVDANRLIDGVVKLTLSARPTFSVGDTLWFPVPENGTSKTMGYATVTRIDEFEVTVTMEDQEYLVNWNKPTVAFYCSDSTAIADGFDYLTVKTAVAGSGVKTFTVMNLANFPNDGAGASRFEIDKSLANGTCVIVNDSYDASLPIRILNNRDTTLGALSFSKKDTQGVELPDGVYYFKNSRDGVTLFPGDVITIKYVLPTTTSYEEIGTTTVTVTDAVQHLCIPNEELGTGAGLDSMTIVDTFISEFSVRVDSVIADISNCASWGDVAKVLASAFRNTLIGYNNRAVVNDIIKFDTKARKLYLDPSASMEYTVGDTVAILLGSGSTEFATEDEMAAFVAEHESSVIGGAMKIMAISPMTGEITVDGDFASCITDETTSHEYQLIDLTSAAMDVYASSHTLFTKLTIDDSKWASVADAESVYGAKCSKLTVAGTTFAGKVRTGDSIIVTDGAGSSIDPDPQTFVVVDVLKIGDVDETIIVKDPLEKLLDESVSYCAVFQETVDIGQMFVVGAYSLYVSSAMQNAAQFSTSEETVYLVSSDGKVFVTDTGADIVAQYSGHTRVRPGVGKGMYIVETSSKCLASSEIGNTFLGLGLATTKYEDIEFNGNPKQVYALTPDGETVARLFLAVQYRFNGTVYEFEGTIVPYVLNGYTQLSIEYAAGFELADSGVTFVVNESGVLDSFLDNNAYDLSQSIYNGVLDGSSTCISFNPDDPAIVNDAVWVYKPANNMSTSTLTTVWNLFLDKDSSDVSFLVAAGTNINNFGVKNIETLNTQVMSAMLTVCEARKDCFAIFGGIGEAEIAKALEKYSGATSFPTTIGRWGAIYDGKGRVFDSFYTHNMIDVDKSIQLAALITANRSGSIFWYPPAGKKKGGVPSAWGTSEKYLRRYSYPEDTESDIAKLINLHVNPTRCTKSGNFFWGDWTLQMEDTAFNQIHVAMLVAGIHKMYYHYLDNYVFSLNTPETRADIQSTIQASLDSIKNARPSGFYMAECICNETNNPQTVVDQGKLNVLLRIQPTKTARWIQLRTELVKTETGNQVTTAMN